MRSQRVNTTEQLWLAFTFFRGWRQGCGNWMKVVKSSNLPITWFWFPWQPDPISSHHDKGHSYGSLHLEICKSFRSSVPEPGQRTNLYFLEITIITEGNNKTYVIMIWLHFTMISALEVIFTSNIVPSSPLSGFSGEDYISWILVATLACFESILAS